MSREPQHAESKDDGYTQRQQELDLQRLQLETCFHPALPLGGGAWRNPVNPAFAWRELPGADTVDHLVVDETGERESLSVHSRPLAAKPSRRRAEGAYRFTADVPYLRPGDGM